MSFELSNTVILGAIFAGVLFSFGIWFVVSPPISDSVPEAENNKRSYLATGIIFILFSIFICIWLMIRDHVQLFGRSKGVKFARRTPRFSFQSFPFIYSSGSPGIPSRLEAI